MKVCDRLPHSRYASGHRANEIVLVAIVDSHIWVRGPDEHGINTAVSFLQVIEITVHGVAARNWIIEVTVVNHHLRLEKTGLGPLESRQVVT